MCINSEQKSNIISIFTFKLIFNASFQNYNLHLPLPYEAPWIASPNGDDMRLNFKFTEFNHHPKIQIFISKRKNKRKRKMLKKMKQKRTDRGEGVAGVGN